MEVGGRGRESYETEENSDDDYNTMNTDGISFSELLETR